MPVHDDFQEQSRRPALTRRSLLGAAGALPAALQIAVGAPAHSHDFLTRDGDFGNVERGNPLPYAQPEAKLRDIGMTRDTWRLEVVPGDGARIDNPLTGARALTFADLMRIAEKKAVRYLKVVTCNNLNAPLGMGLWEGVPLREVIWQTRPVSDIRRVYYFGHHNEDPRQMFRSSLSLSRVMEDPPGDYPVMLCYKLNGEWLTGKRGGPVRMLVPETYGFKSVKWLQRVTLTNLHGANDTYAEENNDVDSWMKTFARFLTHPATGSSRAGIALAGVAQSGLNGLSRVQTWLHPQGAPLPPGDPYFLSAPWQDAEILPPPATWGAGIATIPPGTLGFEGGRPAQWPMRYAIAHWATLLSNVPPGKYELRCRTLDSRDVPQPLPRPFGHGGLNAIESVQLTVSA